MEINDDQIIEPVKHDDANLALLLRIGTERPAEETPAE
mgnify:CR=1 FL=1